MKLITCSRVVLFVAAWLAMLTTTVSYSSDGCYPLLEFSKHQRVEGGYRIHDAIDKVSVVFPAAGWKRLDFTYPGGGYVIDPTTGTTFRYDAIRFGRKPKEFLLWGWSVYEHRWAENWPSTSMSEINQKEFLLEWLRRAIVKREINHPDNLSIVVPLLSSDFTQAQLCPLHLADQKVPIQVQTAQVEGHSSATSRCQLILCSAANTETLKPMFG